MTRTVLVVGTGLIGTSIGLALRDSHRVLLLDAAEEHLRTAVGRGAGERWDRTSAVDLLVLATPPDATTSAYDGVRADVGPDAAVTHVASIQSRVTDDLLAAGAPAARLCGGHPVAGRETAGPEAATADLFAGRPWVVCPTDETSTGAREAVASLARDCGADPVQMAPREHDAAMALVSHVPHLAASATAARLGAGGSRGGDAVQVSGPGLQDTTRVAAGDPELWTQILLGNADSVAPVVLALAADLAEVGHALHGRDRAAVLALLQRGRAGRALVPVKRGDHDRDFVRLTVSVPDAPGQLAAVFGCAGAAGVNIEDVRVEHLPGRPTGLLELSVHAAERMPLRHALQEAGFVVLPDA